MPKLRRLLPSERFRLKENSHQRLHTARRLQFRKTPLEKLHNIPEWFEKGKQLHIQRKVSRGGAITYLPGPEAIAVERGIRSNNPKESTAAKDRLLKHFNYYASYAIKQYFAARPNSPYSFEQIYASMLEKRFPFLLQQIKEKGLKTANYWLNISVRIGKHPTPDHLKNFERRFFAAREEKRKPKLVSPAKISQFPFPERVNIDSSIEGVKLTQIEKEILKMRYEHDMTQEEIGQILRKTRARVQQIESEALAKIRRRTVPVVSEERFFHENAGKEISGTELGRILWGGGNSINVNNKLKTLARDGRITLVRKAKGGFPSVYRIVR